MKVLGFDIRVKRVPKGISSQLKALRTGMKSLSESVQGFAKGSTKAAGRLMTRRGLSGKSAYEVRPTDDGWMITRRGSSVPIRVYTKKQDAVREATRMGKNQKTEVSVFTRQGALQHRQSFSV